MKNILILLFALMTFSAFGQKTGIISIECKCGLVYDYDKDGSYDAEPFSGFFIKDSNGKIIDEIKSSYTDVSYTEHLLVINRVSYHKDKIIGFSGNNIADCLKIGAVMVEDIADFQENIKCVTTDTIGGVSVVVTTDGNGDTLAVTPIGIPSAIDTVLTILTNGDTLIETTITVNGEELGPIVTKCPLADSYVSTYVTNSDGDTISTTIVNQYGDETYTSDVVTTITESGDTLIETTITVDGVPLPPIKSVCLLAPSMDTTVVLDEYGNESLYVFTDQYGLETFAKCPEYVAPEGTTIEALDTSLVITCKKNYTFNISDLITADCLGADYSIGLCSDIPPGVDIDFDDTGYVSIEVDCSCLPDTYSPFVFQYEATCDNSEATTSKGTITVDIEKIEALKNGSYEPMASYTYTVCNTGSTPITGITGTDQTSEGVDIPVLGGPIDLSVGQCDFVSFTSLYTPSAQDFANGFIRNTATFSGTGPTGNTVSDTSDDATDNNFDGIPDNNANQDLNGDGEQDDYTELGLGCDDLEALNATNPQLVKDIMLLPSYPQSSECDEDDIFFPDYLEAQLCDQTGIQFDPFSEDDDQCGSLINASFDFCNHCLVVAPNSDICDLDCDGDGLTNQEECDAGTDPNDPTDVCEFIALMNIACDDATWLHILQLADCDNGGTPEWWDCANTGGDPTVPTDDCDQAVNNNLNICLLINGDPTHPFAALDCDGGGVDNLTECQNGGSPSDSSDDCQSAINANLDICAIIAADATHPFATQDCDDGGVSNADECAAGFDPTDPVDDVPAIALGKNIMGTLAEGETVIINLYPDNQLGPLPLTSLAFSQVAFSGTGTPTNLTFVSNSAGSPAFELAIGENGHYTYDYVITAADMLADPLVLTCSMDVTGTDPYGNTVTDISDDNGNGDSINSDTDGDGNPDENGDDDPSSLGGCVIVYATCPMGVWIQQGSPSTVGDFTIDDINTNLGTINFINQINLGGSGGSSDVLTFSAGTTTGVMSTDIGGVDNGWIHAWDPTLSVDPLTSPAGVYFLEWTVPDKTSNSFSMGFNDIDAGTSGTPNTGCRIGVEGHRFGWYRTKVVSVAGLTFDCTLGWQTAGATEPFPRTYKIELDFTADPFQIRFLKDGVEWQSCLWPTDEDCID